MTDELAARRAWAMWLAGTVTTFAVLEAAALASRRDGVTLTATVRFALGIRPARPWGRLGAAAFATGCAVLASHIITGRP